MAGSREETPFMRVVGRRRAPREGSPPPPESRAAMTEMAGYRTRAPKGVFLYRNHEEANADRDRWLLAAMAAMADDPDG